MNLLSLLSLSIIPFTAAQSALLWANNIQSDGKFLGLLEIYNGQEPVDATDSFVTTHIGTGGGSDFVGIRNSILDIVCEAITCNRRVPVVYRKSIVDDQENILGFIEIYEGEEAVDAVSRFFKTTERKFGDETMDAVKDYVISEACSNDRVLCSRDAAIAFDQMVNNGIDDSPIGRLVILENEDPADKVYKWCEEKNILQYYDGRHSCCIFFLIYSSTLYTSIGTRTHSLLSFHSSLD